MSEDIYDLWMGQRSTEKPPYPEDGAVLELDLLSLKKLVRGFRITDLNGNYWQFGQGMVTQIADNMVAKQKIMKVQYIARDFAVKGSQSKILILE